jgi:hypothetical protein
MSDAATNGGTELSQAEKEAIAERVKAERREELKKARMGRRRPR